MGIYFAFLSRPDMTLHVREELRMRTDEERFTISLSSYSTCVIYFAMLVYNTRSALTMLNIGDKGLERDNPTDILDIPQGF